MVEKADPDIGASLAIGRDPLVVTVAYCLSRLPSGLVVTGFVPAEGVVNPKWISQITAIAPPSRVVSGAGTIGQSLTWGPGGVPRSVAPGTYLLVAGLADPAGQLLTFALLSTYQLKPP